MSKIDNIDSFWGMSKEQRKEVKDGRRKAAIKKGINPRLVPHVILHGVEHKSCCQCGSLKPLDEFNADSSKGDGKHSYCRDCNKNYTKGRKS